MTTNYIFPGDWTAWMTALARAWHQRSAWRFGVIIIGIVLAQGRRTVTSWFRAANITKHYKAFYYFIGAVGKKTETIATILLEIMIHLIYRKNPRVLMAIDDSPTKRYGPKVQGAGIHRNPTPGPQGHKFLYGHIWVSLSALVRHKSWGTIGLPLLAKMYVRAKDIATVPKHYQISFQNKLQQASELVQWAAECCKRLDKTLWIVTDGGYTRAGFLKPVIRLGVTVITRLRKDAALHALPRPVKKRKRGRPRKYGRRLDLRQIALGKYLVTLETAGKKLTRKAQVKKTTNWPVGIRE